MADPNITIVAPSCPRCGTPRAQRVARSPVPGAWEMHLCGTCFYSWRSTEPAYATTPEGIARGFRIDPATLSLGKVMPAVPPLRETVAQSDEPPRT